MALNNRIHILREVVVRVVRILADRGVEVTQNGTRAFCAWNIKTGELERVNIPQIPNNADEDFIRALHGFIDHEVAHILFTDSQALLNWAKELKQEVVVGNITNQEFSDRKTMQNIAEDVYIEHRMRATYTHRACASSTAR